MKKNILNSIPKTIILISLTFTLGISLIIAIFSSYIYQTKYKNQLVSSTEINLRFLASSINSNWSNILNFNRWCQTNNTILNYVSDTTNNSTLALSAHERLTEEYQNLGNSSYIHRIVITACTDKYLQIVPVVYSTSKNVAQGAKELDYFDKLYTNPSYDFSIGLQKDPFYTASPKNVMTIIRPITYKFKSNLNGWLFMQINTDYFCKPLKNYNAPEDSTLLYHIGDFCYIADAEQMTYSPDPYTVLNSIDAKFIDEGTKAFNIITKTGKKSILVQTPINNMEGCYISQTISLTELNTQTTLFYYIILFVFVSIIILTGILIYLLNRTIIIPVKQLKNHISVVSTGDFSYNSSIEWNHELGDIGKGINELSRNVEALMEKRIEDEKQKSDLEYKMLQSQINPHFIYNTLNSIKWMATIQNATGIAEMTTALSRLLKSISKGTTLLVPIRDELDLLREYFTIQQYRYGNTLMLDINVSDNDLLDCSIVKFTLQPLVENAIFHGIEPKGTIGTITINVTETDKGDIQIEIIDNGVGMDEETAKNLFTKKFEPSSSFFKEIGINNVHKRIQYEFGTSYGMSISSEVGEFTNVCILLPKVIFQ